MPTHPKIVALGGGTGLSVMLRGLKKYTENITAIVTMADDGGGSGVLRHDLGMLPPGDIRNCLLSLAEIEPTMRELFNYRFSEGTLRGQSFGNLFIAAMVGISENFEEAVKKASEVLAVHGNVIPVTCADIHLCAHFEDGSEVFGESKIARAKKLCNSKITSVSLVPENVKPTDGVIESIMDADIIILGPGSLYTSIIPNLLVKGVADAIKKSSAPVLYICNIMTQPGETEEYMAIDHINAISKHAGGNIIDYCIVNSGAIDGRMIEKYALDNSAPVLALEERINEQGIKLICDDIYEITNETVRHSSTKLTKLIKKFWKEYSGE